MTTTITDIDTQVYGPNVHVWGDDFPDDKNYQRFVDEFEYEKIQTISTQLYNVFYECHMNIKVGDRDMLKKIIDEMVKYRLDDSRLDKYVPTLERKKPRLKKQPRIYRFLCFMCRRIDMQVYNEYERQYQEQCKLDERKINACENLKRLRALRPEYVEEDEFYRQYLKELVQRRWDDIEFNTAILIARTREMLYASSGDFNVLHIATFVKKTPHEEIMKIAFGESGKLSTHINPL